MSSPAPEWNRRTDLFTVLRAPLDPGQLLRSAFKLGVGTSLACFLAWEHSGVLAKLGLPGLPTAAYLKVLGCVAALLLGAYALQAAAPHPKPPGAAAALTNAQRRLLGLEPLPDKKPAGRPQAKKAASPLPPLGPALRAGRAALATPPVATQDQTVLRASPSPGPPRSYTPGGGEVTTPEQLKRVVDEFDRGVLAIHSTPGSQPEFGYAATPPEYRPGLGGRGTAASPSLPVGAAVPTYQPSAVPKGAAALPARADGRLAQSTQEAQEAVLSELGLNQRALEGDCEAFREWMASDVLQPLLLALGSAHEEVAQTAARLGGSVQLSPLSDFGSSSAAASTSLRADDELVIAQLREHVLGRLRSFGSMAPQPELVACFEAVNKYEKLSALLRGDFPPGLLLPAPQGYITSRIRSLAEGTCMGAFKWNSGGRWNNKPWTPELPTDSALVLYLFAAFLAAPKWAFPQDASQPSGPGGALYLGKLPAKVVGEYFAILRMPPPEGHKATAVLGLQLGTPQPYLSLMLHGRSAVTLSGQSAVFQALVLFLTYCAREAHGMIGGRSLEYLGLSEVLKPARPTEYLLARLRLSRFMLW